jgi:hypothetical protein
LFSLVPRGQSQDSASKQITAVFIHMHYARSLSTLLEANNYRVI